MSKYTARDITITTTLRRHKDGVCRPAQLSNPLADSLIVRIKLAFGVLVGNYDALDWEEHD